MRGKKFEEKSEFRAFVFSPYKKTKTRTFLNLDDKRSFSRINMGFGS